MKSMPTSRPIASIWNRNFICVFFVNALLSLALSSTNTLVSTYAQFLGAGAVLIGALTGMFYAVAFAMRPISGPVTTKLDKRALIVFATVLGIIVNTGYAFTHSIGLFLVFRVLNGIQFSIIGSLCMAIAGDSLPQEKLGSGMGIFGLGGAVAMAVGPSIGLALRDIGNKSGGEAWGYTLVFLFASVCFVVSLIPAVLFKIPKRSREELATAGAWYKNIVAAQAIAPAIVTMLLTIGYALYNTYMLPYADAQGIIGVGAFYTVFAIALIAIRPVSGPLVDKLGVFKVTIAGCALFALSFLIVGFGHSLITVLIASAVGAIGYSSAQPAIQAMCIQCVVPVKRPVASNTNFFGMDMGFFLGPLLGGVMYSVFGSYSTMFLTMVVPVVLAAVVLSICWPSFIWHKAQIDNHLATLSLAAEEQDDGAYELSY